MKNLILVVFLVLSVSNAFADNCSVSNKKLAIYFSNGMSNDRRDAKVSLEELISKTQSTLQSKGYTLNYEISYNKNEDWYYQILEAFRQRKLEEWSLFYR